MTRHLNISPPHRRDHAHATTPQGTCNSGRGAGGRNFSRLSARGEAFSLDTGGNSGACSRSSPPRMLDPLPIRDSNRNQQIQPVPQIPAQSPKGSAPSESAIIPTREESEPLPAQAVFRQASCRVRQFLYSLFWLVSFQRKIKGLPPARWLSLNSRRAAG